jgi:hypothetical protein
MKITVYSGVIPCGFVDNCRCFASICYFNLQGKQQELRGRKNVKYFTEPDCTILYHSYCMTTNRDVDYRYSF